MLHVHLYRLVRVALLLLLAAFALPAPARADAGLEDGLTRLADTVVKFLDGEGGAKAITVGDFIAPPRIKAAGGPGISQLLAEKLKAKKVTVGDKAPFQLIGRFSLNEEKERSDSAFDSLALRIRAEVLDDDDDVVQVISLSVFGDAPLQLGGGTAEIPPRASEEERQKAFKESITDPQAATVGAETRAASDSPFAVTVLVGGRPRQPEIKDGRSFVRLGRGEEYTVQLHNRAPFEVAVTLTIDGLNMFAFSEAGEFGGAVLVSPGQTVDIPGWFVTPEKSEAFLLTSYPESAAGQRGVTSGVGVITASFCAAWDPKHNPPPDEVSPKGADSATGRGRPIEKKYVEVQRVLGRTRAVVSVRYDR